MKVSKNLAGSLLVAALGLSKRYQRKAVHLAKIKGVSYYLRSIRLVRKQCLVVVATLFSLILLTAGLIVVPLGLVYYSAWTSQAKMIATFLIAALYTMIAFGVLWHYFSEERWMKLSGSTELIDRLVKVKENEQAAAIK